MNAIRIWSLGLGLFAAVFWGISAVYWFLSAGVEIHNSQDAFINDLRDAAHWNAWAARYACAASVFTFTVAVCEILQTVKAWKRGRSTIG
jgi:hypothetical protein